MNAIKLRCVAMCAFLPLSIIGPLYGADRAPLPDLTRAINWVQREGRSITDSGRPVQIHPRLAAMFGMEPAPWPAKQKAFGPIATPDVTCLFQVAEANGQREFVVTCIEPPERVFWRVTQDGRILSTVFVPALGQPPVVVPNELRAELWMRRMHMLLDAVPP